MAARRVLLCGFVGVICALAQAQEAQPPATPTPSVPVLIARLRSNSWPERQKAALTLRHSGAEQAVRPLLSALKWECVLCPHQRAARGWQSASGGGSVEATSQILKGAYLFGLVGLKSAARAQVTAASEDAPDEFAAYLLVIRGYWGEAEALEPLLDMLQHNPDGHLRANAAGALGELGSKAAIPALQAALEDEFTEVSGDRLTPLVRLAARGALTKLGAPPPPRTKPDGP